MCDATGSSCADPLYVSTGKWGDVVSPFGGGAQPGFGDISQVVDKFKGEGTAPDMPRTDLVRIGSAGDPNVPDQRVTFADITAALNGFGQFAYPFAIPACDP